MNKELTYTDSILLDSDGKLRNLFKKRREFVEQHFLGSPPEIRQFETANGGQIRVLSQTCVLSDELKKKPSERDLDRPLQMTVYIPGLSRLNPPNLGNVPEIHLASGIITGDTDAIMMVKPEGINDEAYTAHEGFPQEDTSQAALEIVLEQINQLLENKPGREVELRIVGLSEGSTIAPSLIARLLESNLSNIHVQELVSVSAGGLSGPSNLNLAGLVSHLKRTKGTMKKSQAYYDQAISAAIQQDNEDGKNQTAHLNQYSLNLGDGERFVDGRVLTGAIYQEGKPDGLENAIGERAQDLGLDMQNFLSVLKHTVATQFGIPREVPLKRLEAAFAKNRDWETIAAADIPTMIVTSTRDTFYSNMDTRNEVQKLKQTNPNWHPALIGTNIEHGQYHQYSQAIAGLIRFVKDSNREI